MDKINNMRKLTKKELQKIIETKSCPPEYVDQLIEELNQKDDTFIEKIYNSVIQDLVDNEQYERAFELKMKFEGKTEEQLLNDIEKDIKKIKKKK